MFVSKVFIYIVEVDNRFTFFCTECRKHNEQTYNDKPIKGSEVICNHCDYEMVVGDSIDSREYDNLKPY